MWDAFATVWDDIVGDLRSSDIVSDEEAANLHFTRLGHAQGRHALRPVLLPAFFYAGQVQAFVDTGRLDSGAQGTILTELRSLLLWLGCELGWLAEADAGVVICTSFMQTVVDVDHANCRAHMLRAGQSLIKQLSALCAEAAEQQQLQQQQGQEQQQQHHQQQQQQQGPGNHGGGGGGAMAGELEYAAKLAAAAKLPAAKTQADARQQPASASGAAAAGGSSSNAESLVVAHAAAVASSLADVLGALGGECRAMRRAVRAGRLGGEAMAEADQLEEVVEQVLFDLSRPGVLSSGLALLASAHPPTMPSTTPTPTASSPSMAAAAASFYAASAHGARAPSSPPMPRAAAAHLTPSPPARRQTRAATSPAANAGHSSPDHLHRLPRDDNGAGAAQDGSEGLGRHPGPAAPELLRLRWRVVGVLASMLNTPATACRPASAEAQRILGFFINSLSNPQLKKPAPVCNMRSWSVLTPCYEEDVLYPLDASLVAFQLGLAPPPPSGPARLQDLLSETEDHVSLIAYLRSVFPGDWHNFLERLGTRLGGADLSRATEHDFGPAGPLFGQALDLQLWATYRGQLLGRTVRGMMCYRSAVRMLVQMEYPRPEGVSAAEYGAWVEALVDSKFQYVCACQVYGRTRKAADIHRRWLAEGVDTLCLEFPALQVAFLDSAVTASGPADYSVLITGNTRHPRAVARSALGAAAGQPQPHLGATNTASDSTNASTTSTSCSAKGGSSASCAGASATVELYRIRLPCNRYSGRGVVLGEDKPENQNHAAIFCFGEALQTIDMNQDNALAEALKMRNLLHGRDMGFDSINAFEIKISGGGGECVVSRDVARLAPRLDLARLLHFYHSGLGYYINSLLIMTAVTLNIWVIALFALARASSVQMADSEGVVRFEDSLRVEHVLSLGPLMLLPYAAQLLLEGGLLRTLATLCVQLVAGSLAFAVFRQQTTAHYFKDDMTYGGASYISTGRGFSITSSSFTTLYTNYARSHLYQGAQLLHLLLLYAAVRDCAACSYAAVTWGTWLVCFSLLLAPFWFNPLAFRADKELDPEAAPAKLVRAAARPHGSTTAQQHRRALVARTRREVPVALVGFREWIFSGVSGALGTFGAACEFAFGTIVQRTMSYPGRVRMHYGHPDVFNKLHIMTRGGVSKATRQLHISEDVFGGFNHTLRGGQIKYKEYISCGNSWKSVLPPRARTRLPNPPLLPCTKQLEKVRNERGAATDMALAVATRLCEEVLPRLLMTAAAASRLDLRLRAGPPAVRSPLLLFGAATALLWAGAGLSWALRRRLAARGAGRLWRIFVVASCACAAALLVCYSVFAARLFHGPPLSSLALLLYANAQLLLAVHRGVEHLAPRSAGGMSLVDAGYWATDALAGTLLLCLVTLLAWLGFVSRLQTRLLFNATFADSIRRGKLVGGKGCPEKTLPSSPS
ncbi:putative callose synthase 6 [Tetrabaena socialis]|uniref:Putative callose synthase 6 n=1 Tax=Tetrabaena socialis TaxID=47790 RepID=A0A2J8AA15_9CHLO|nr:putative callose synthase 6 [Tetrabaena socialis]|eukprot:PNH09351.1 putative callose synthase 6 [Tetrabaena socialis]